MITIQKMIKVISKIQKLNKQSDYFGKFKFMFRIISARNIVELVNLSYNFIRQGNDVEFLNYSMLWSLCSSGLSALEKLIIS